MEPVQRSCGQCGIGIGENRGTVCGTAGRKCTPERRNASFECSRSSSPFFRRSEGNAELAAEMLKLGEERLKAGSITNFEFRETQSQWRSAREALLSARIATRTAEIQVKLLTGDILK